MPLEGQADCAGRLNQFAAISLVQLGAANQEPEPLTHMPELLFRESITKRAVILIGLPGSGKSTGAAFLKELGFAPISAGDTIRALCEKEGLALTRENLSAYGQRMLSEHGSDYFAELLLDKPNKLQKVQFQSIRPSESFL